MTSFMTLRDTRGLIWVHVWVDMGSRERAVMGLESRAISAGITKHFVTIFSKTCNNNNDDNNDDNNN